MRPIFYYGFITATLFATVYFGLNYSDIRHTIKEQAASIYQTNNESSDVDENYISLIDIVASSLEHIKNAASTVATDSAEKIIESITPNTSPTPSTDLADAIVNILCVYETSEYRRTISGTGFMISKDGVILTNAHVAQFLLLKNSSSVKNASCTVRVSNERGDSFPAGLLYISPTWVIANADMITSENPRGSGENDFALLYVTDLDEAAPAFPFIPVSTGSSTSQIIGSTVILVGYPSSDEVSASAGFARRMATTTIANIYTFGSGTADVLSLSESILGHNGASGGPVINHLGQAIGVISTKENDNTKLNAITTTYIDRRMREETGFDLQSTIQGNLPSRAELFNKTVSPILGEVINQSLR